MSKNKQTSPLDRPTKYILKNTTNRDINIGDLRYTIPAGQSRDLLKKTAHLDYDLIIKSKEHGSISKRLGKSLIEIDAIVEASAPQKTIADPSIVYFPQRTKSSIVIDVSEISEDVQQEASVEEDELLKQLNQSYEESVAPLIAREDNEKDKKTST